MARPYRLYLSETIDKNQDKKTDFISLQRIKLFPTLITDFYLFKYLPNTNLFFVGLILVVQDGCRASHEL